MGCSGLNGHLFHFLHVIDDPCCRCGYNVEAPAHFFFDCPLYAVPRNNMLTDIGNITNGLVNINIILFGCKECTLEENKSIFDIVYTFIRTSKRFKWNTGIH